MILDRVMIPDRDTRQSTSGTIGCRLTFCLCWPQYFRDLFEILKRHFTENLRKSEWNMSLITKLIYHFQDECSTKNIGQIRNVISLKAYNYGINVIILFYLVYLKETIY